MRDQSRRAGDLECADGRHRGALLTSAVHAGPHLRQAVAAGMTSNGKSGEGVTIVMQTRVRPGNEDAFAQWQKGTSEAIARYRGFVQQTVMSPSPPAQVDWVILQRFATTEGATAWLNSKERRDRLAGAQAMLIGPDDVHLVANRGEVVLPAPVSAVISTRIKPGSEAAYREGAAHCGGAVEGA